MSLNFDLLYKYFQESMAYLTKAGKEFSAKYPKVAQTLQIDESNIKDPDVIRLLEAFAFFDARLHLNLHQERNITNNLMLSIVAPELTSHIPAGSIIELQTPAKLQEITVPQFTEILVVNSDGITCKFTSARSHILQYVTLESIELIETHSNENLYWTNCDQVITISANFRSHTPSLRLYINSEHRRAVQILQSILTNQDDKMLNSVFDHKTRRKIGCIKHLSDYGRATPTHLLGNPFFDLHTYSIIPESFQFFDIIFHSTFSHETITMVIPLNKNIKLQPNIFNSRLFLLNCISCVNLFSKKSEPVNLQLAQTEYNIVTDLKQDLYKFYSINSVNITTNDGCISYLTLGKDYFMQVTNHEEVILSIKSKFDDDILIENSVLYADLICSNGDCVSKIIVNASITLSNINQLKGNMLLIPGPTRSTDSSDKWKLLSICLSNELDNIQQDKLTAYIDQVMSIYSLNFKSTLFNKVEAEETVGVLSKYSAWNTIVPKKIVKLELTQEIPESFLLGLLWAKIFLRTTPFSGRTEVILHNSRNGEYLIDE